MQHIYNNYYYYLLMLQNIDNQTCWTKIYFEVLCKGTEWLVPNNPMLHS